MIEIDISQVQLLGRQNDPRFIRKHDAFQTWLSNLANLWDVCLHEAGHSIFFRRAGVIKFDYYGPTITYDQQTDEFLACSAMVEPSCVACRPDNNQTVLAIAKGCAAGGVITSGMTSQIDRGDDIDYQRLCAFLEKLRKKYPNNTIDPGNLWKGAQICVERDLRNLLVREDEIKVEARTVEPLIFKTHNFSTFLDPPSFSWRS